MLETAKIREIVKSELVPTEDPEKISSGPPSDDESWEDYDSEDEAVQK